jgi:hypothetical protein
MESEEGPERGGVVFFLADLEEAFFFPSLIQSKRKCRRSVVG